MNAKTAKKLRKAMKNIDVNNSKLYTIDDKTGVIELRKDSNKSIYKQLKNKYK